jgi:hypothetical protein
MPAVTINHASMYASDPPGAARHLAAIVGGEVVTFHPLPDAWVCLFQPGDWKGGLVEFYPRTATLAHDDGAVTFRDLPSPSRGGGSHLNMTVPRTRAALEALCRERGLVCAWRDWAGFLDVWLEDDLLIECVCAGDAKKSG